MAILKKGTPNLGKPPHGEGTLNKDRGMVHLGIQKVHVFMKAPIFSLGVSGLAILVPS